MIEKLSDSQAGNALAQLDGFLPDVQHRVRAQRHQDAGTGRLQQGRDVLHLQQEVDRHRITGALGASERGVCLDQAGQHAGHPRARAAER